MFLPLRGMKFKLLAQRHLRPYCFVSQPVLRLCRTKTPRLSLRRFLVRCLSTVQLFSEKFSPPDTTIHDETRNFQCGLNRPFLEAGRSNSEAGTHNLLEQYNHALLSKLVLT